MFKFFVRRRKKLEEIETLVDYTTYLPSEIWTKILGYLPLVDLCQVVRVSWFMNSVGSDPMLWTAVKINHSKAVKELQQRGQQFWKNFGGFLDINRFSLIIMDEIDCSMLQLKSTSEFKYLMTYDSIENINLSGLNLSKVDDEVLAHGLSHFHKLNLSRAVLTPQQVSSFIRASFKSTTLHTVNLQSVNSIYHIPAKVLSPIVHQLVKIDLSFTKLTTEQVNSLLLNVISSKRIKAMRLLGINMCDVEPQLFSSAVTHLQDVALGGTEVRFGALSNNHINLLFSQCLETRKLKELELSTVSLNNVEPDNMAKAIVGFENVIFKNNLLHTFQLITILSRCLEATSLKKLCLDENDLSEVDDTLLAQAVSNIPLVSLQKTKLTNLQLSAIFSLCAHRTRSNCLQELSVSGADLRGIHSELIANGIKNLVVANLSYTQVESDQIKDVLKAVSISKNIEFLNLENVPKAFKFRGYRCFEVLKMNKKVDIKIKPNESMRSLLNESIYAKLSYDQEFGFDIDLLSELGLYKF